MYQMKMTTKIVLNTKMEINRLKKKRESNPIKKSKTNILDSVNLDKNSRLNINI